MSWQVSAVFPRHGLRSPNLLEGGKGKLIISEEGEHYKKRQTPKWAEKKCRTWEKRFPARKITGKYNSNENMP